MINDNENQDENEKQITIYDINGHRPRDINIIDIKYKMYNYGYMY